jgi:hypothetical protein
MKLTPEQEALIVSVGKTVEDFNRDMDEIPSSPINRNVIDDIGEGLMLSLQNDDQIGFDIVMLLMRIDELERRISILEGGNT